MTLDFAEFARVDPRASALLDAHAQPRMDASLDRAQARVARAAKDVGGELGLAAIARWLGAKRLWDAIPEERRASVRPHPAFRYFVQGVHRARTPSATLHASNGFPQLMWAAGLEHGVGWRGAVQLDYRGGLRAPGYARHIEFGEERALQTAQLTLEEDRAALAFPDGLSVQIAKEDAIGWPIDRPSLDEHGYEVRFCPRLGRAGLCIDARDQWLRVRLTGSNQRADGVAFDDWDDERYEDDPSLRHIDDALGLIDAVWPDELDEIARFVRIIVPFKSPERTHAAFTVSSRQGAIFIGEAPMLATAEAIAHEAAHVKLRQIQLLDPLLADPLDDSVRVRVPWRPDPRPLPGVFEGVFVFAHVAELMRRLADQGDTSARSRCEQIRGDLRTGVALVREQAKLTVEGERFFDALCGWADTA